MQARGTAGQGTKGGTGAGQAPLMAHYAMALRNVYDELFELNLTRGTYAILHHTEGKYIIPALNGELDTMLLCVADNMVHPDDRECFVHFCAKVRSLGTAGLTEKLEFECRKRLHTGHYGWVQLLVLPVSDDEDNILICYVLDINERRAMEESTALLQQICKATVLDEYDELGLVHVADGRYVPFSLPNEDQGHHISYEAYVRDASAHVVKEDKRRFQTGMDLRKVLRALSESGVFLMQARRITPRGPRWTSTRMTYFNGCKDTILCTLRDIHETHALEEGNRELLQSMLQSLGNMYSSIVEIDPVHESVTLVKSAQLPHSEGRVTRLNRLIRFMRARLFDNDREAFQEECSAQSLRRRLGGGRFHRSLEVRLARPDGGFEWQEINIFSVLRNNSMGNTVLVTMHSVEERRLLKAIVGRLAYRTYDFFMQWDMRQNTYVMHGRSESSTPLKPRRGKYSELVNAYIPMHVVEEDQVRMLEEVSALRVREELGSKDEYVTYCGVWQRGAYARKRYAFMYFDKSAEAVLVTCTDVSDVYNEEKNKSDLLRETLQKAELANRAKTDFLSRMSHDIRTPMNAIMGMSTIAQTCINKKERVEECLKKIDISSQFLLALINDVLDMSRIESGMMHISLSRFDLTDLLREITTLIITQASSKGIDFEASIGANLARYYTGDPLRINQVLVNLLSNALKNTRQGGKIRLDIEEVERTESGSRLRMAVSDTGAGMSREFMDRMYEPFEQEKIGTARNQVGTGLGLSIVNSLVGLMGGHIEVQSELGVGTTFTVILDLAFPQGVEPGSDPDKGELAGLRILLVDADSLSGEYLALLLSGLGLEITVVSSGSEALALVEDQWPDCSFDLALVDWKMPGMDGEEVVLELRKRMGRKVAFVLMSAHDTYALQDIVKHGGADACLTKPAFRKPLAEALYRARSLALQSRRSPHGESRLEGMRVLVVEDNEINIEIVKTLLEEEGALVEMAENGAVAVDMFRRSSVPYDVVLMDIRMPVMDGIEATKNIRAMEDRSRRAVPIVAMSANAFQEDVDLAKEAGVTHYLAKPVEVEKLYAQLELLV